MAAAASRPMADGPYSRRSAKPSGDGVLSPSQLETTSTSTRPMMPVR